jgi:hypothetical protein
MINLEGNTLDIGFRPRYTIASLETDSFALESTPNGTNVDYEDPFVMGRTLLAFVIIELIIGFGVYMYLR